MNNATYAKITLRMTSLEFDRWLVENEYMHLSSTSAEQVESEYMVTLENSRSMSIILFNDSSLHTRMTSIEVIINRDNVDVGIDDDTGSISVSISNKDTGITETDYNGHNIVPSFEHTQIQIKPILDILLI